MADICQFVCSYRTPSGYCGSTGGYATCQHRKMDEPPTIKSAEPMTNADKYFRNATDEEIAEELLDWFNAFYAVEWSKNAVLDWLKQEAEESEN